MGIVADHVINIDFLQNAVIVFKTTDEYLSFCEEYEITPRDDLNGIGGFAYHIEHSESGENLFFVGFNKDHVEYRTILHETSHIVDYLTDYHGIKPCSEFRAYFHDWLFDEVCKIVKGDNIP